MQKQVFVLLSGVLFLFIPFLNAQNKMVISDKILFYDGYNNLDTLASETVPHGVFRIKTSLITTKLTEEQFNMFDGEIIMDIVLKAACDNFDRMGNVNLAFVFKDSQSYTPESRIGLECFITPFMNKNRQPDTIPYQYNLSNLKHIFQDQQLRG